MRVDKRGVGDSEGAPCASIDFATELADHRAALAQLAADPRVDPARIVIFGHSVGGMIAPIIGDAARAIMVYGTSTARWIDCLVASRRRQLGLRGVTADEIDRAVRALAAELATSPPNGRSAAYHAQLAALDLEAAWARVGADVLVLRGLHDWVVGAEEQARIVEIVGARGCLADVAGADHLLTSHATIEDSLAAYGRGVFDRALVDLTVDWMRASGVSSHS
jgi:pimeloyl-ACP methyl ester carboxylesterase